MDYFDLSPGEVWEDRYDPRDGDDERPADSAPERPLLTDEELAALAPWF